MLKQFFSFIILLGISLSAYTAEANNIAVIDIEGAVAKSNYAQKARKDLENSKSFQDMRTRYNELGKQLEAMEKDAKANGLTWSKEQKESHNQSAKEKLLEIKKINRQLDSEVNEINKKMAQELNPRIDTIVNDIIKEKNIGLLLKAGAVHFATPGFDITEELLERLNKTN